MKFSNGNERCKSTKNLQSILNTTKKLLGTSPERGTRNAELGTIASPGSLLVGRPAGGSMRTQ
jgi:hypothetical protein